MADEATTEELRQRLHDIDAEIAELRKSVDDLKSQRDGVEDSEDIAADLTFLEEQQALLALLERRRGSVLEQLGQGGSSA